MPIIAANVREFGSFKSGVIVTQQNTQSLQKIALSITVKVLSADSSGSGILIQNQNGVYTVVTNDHVLIGSPVYRVQTHDGQIYLAQTRDFPSLRGKDLGVLQFKSNATYTVAFLTSSLTLKEGDKVYAAGFPIEADSSQSMGFKLTVGEISLLPDKALKQGYQIGYTNEIEKGMSGGPVLNQQGQVVAINGMHAYPLWGNPYIFQDGSLPCSAMREVMVQSSWGIPIETFASLANFLVNQISIMPSQRSSFSCSHSVQSLPKANPINSDYSRQELPTLREPLW